MQPFAFRQTCVITSLAFALTLMLSRPALADENAASPPQPEKSRISGRTLDIKGKSIAAARITLYLDDVDAPRRHYWKLKTIETDTTGAYTFSDLPEGWYLVVAEHDGEARSFRYIVLEGGLQLTQDFTLRKPVSSSIIIRDEQGQPIAGATLRTLEFRDGNGEFWLRRREDWQTFAPSITSSGQDGRLHLPELPEESIVAATIDHPKFAPVTIKDITAHNGVVTETVMKPGAEVTLKFAHHDGDAAISEVGIELWHDPFSHPSTMLDRRIQLDEGVATFIVDPGRYRYLRLNHDDYFVLPEYNVSGIKGEYLRIDVESDNEFHFQLRPKIMVRGRVIDASTGQPLAGMSILGELLNPRTNIETAKPQRTKSEWTRAGWSETDEKGEYSLELAAGPARISFQSQGYIADANYLELTVSADGSTVASDLEVRPMPKVAGKVVDAEGRPVSNAVVRMRGMLRFTQPAASDQQGRFEISPSWIPTDPETDESLPVQPLVAFLPHERLSTRVDVNLAEPDSLQDLTLTLAPHAPGALIDDFREELSDWERGESDKDRTAERAQQSLVGLPALPLEGTWINIDPPSNGLDTFRGKYVLLDFWFIGCGPCHAEEPSLKLLHEVYKDHGLVVVSVHDNSATAEAVAEYASKHEFPYPVLVDHPDGRTINRYEGHGVEGYPSYLLIGPDGTIIEDDLVSPGPSLRLYKFELIRELLLKRSSR